MKKLFFLTLLFTSCATFHQQKGDAIKESIEVEKTANNIIHKFILIGDAGENLDSEVVNNFKNIEKKINASDSLTTVLFLGNNIGYKHESDSASLDLKINKIILNNQLNLVKKFKGKSHFLPGNLDWGNGLDGLLEQKKYITNFLNDSLAFLPKNYESINEIEINDKISLITIDSEWFIQDWNRYNKINHGSEIRSREDFFEKFKLLINKNQNKVTLVAMHHPVLSGGAHAGYFGLREHLFPYKNIPLPILGSIYTYWRKTSGENSSDMQYKLYQSLIKRLKTIVAEQKQVIFISAHEDNLQYIESKTIKQVISGAASNVKQARAVVPTSFSVGKLGYGILEVYEDKQTKLSFFVSNKQKDSLIFSRTIFKEDSKLIYDNKSFVNTIGASIYDPKETQKGFVYKALFGNHYRDLYSTVVNAPVALLDTVYGGLTPILSDIDEQNYFLRLKNNSGDQYEMRRIRKNPDLLLSKLVFKDIYLKDKVTNTYLSNFIKDFYTTAHPYIPLVMGDLAKAVNLKYPKTALYYVPKQEALEHYNANFGDELYIVSDYYSTTNNNLDSFKKPVEGDILSTEAVVFFLQNSPNFKIDTDLYLKNRLFDFLIGDWDKNPNQWVWEVSKSDDFYIFKPIVKNWNQAFSKMDGIATILLKSSPAFRHMNGFSSNYASPRWINKFAFPLDKFFLQNTTIDQWKSMAHFIKNQITEKVVVDAFNNLPHETQGLISEEIKEILLKRSLNLVNYSEIYYKELFKYGIVIGTNSQDNFIISTSKKNINVMLNTSDNNGNDRLKSFDFNPNITKEIWFYGLDNKDFFHVSGTKSNTKIKLMGGGNHDQYLINTKNKVVIHDYQSDESSITKSSNTRVLLRNNYVLNEFDYRNSHLNIFTFVPDLGYNKDNGLMLGFNAKLIVKKYNDIPFSQSHRLKAKYDYATNGAMFEYLGMFKNNSANWYYQVDFNASSFNYSQNFFGLGNVTPYSRKLFKINYYRVRTEQLLFYPSYNYSGRNGGEFLFGPIFESIRISNTENRFIDTYIEDYKTLNYDSHKYFGAQAKYQFSNFNTKGNATLGFNFMLHYGFRSLLSDFRTYHSFVTSSVGFVVPINHNETITLESLIYGKTIIGKDFKFYHAANIGYNNYLRGFRQNRFTGRSAFVQSSDINFKIAELNRGLLPLTYGVSLGFDYGRVWQDFETSKKWHTSVGAGVWIDVLEAMKLKVNAYKSYEDIMISFSFDYKL